MDGIVLLNKDMTVLAVLSWSEWKKAIGYVERGKAEIVKTSTRTVSYGRGVKSIPKILRMLYLVVKKFATRKISYSSRMVFLRDNHTCMYCGQKSRNLTIDHVLPRCRGGATSFENTATACKACNNAKGARTPEEAGMQLIKKPYVPSAWEVGAKKLKAFGSIDLAELYTEIFK